MAAPSTGSAVPVAAAGDNASPEQASGDTLPTDDTIPLNKDDRPPELKLFDAFGKFRSCLEAPKPTSLINGDRPVR